MEYLVEIRQPEHFQGEPWCVRFRASVDGEVREVRVTNLARMDAERFLECWQRKIGEGSAFCGLCPSGDRSCRHDETPAQRGWSHHEIIDPYIMPMQVVR